MTSNDDRRAELIAGALADDLTAAEQQELHDLAALDPSVDAEMFELKEMVDGVSASQPWIDARPDGGLRSRVMGSSPRRYTMVAAAAAIGILAGVVGVLGVQGVRNSPVTGPPGTLGAYEKVEFESSAGLDVQGGLVAHTWGTETVLEVTGVQPDAVYGVFLRDRSGASRESGTFLGTPVPIDCAMNAAVDRPDVVGLEIRTAQGDVVATAEVPTVT